MMDDEDDDLGIMRHTEGTSSLFLPFDSDDPEFSRGVTIGILHQRLNSEPMPVTMTVPAVCAEMMFRLAEAHGVLVRSEDLDDEWLQVTFGR